MRLTNAGIKENLTALRNDIRSGKVRVSNFRDTLTASLAAEFPGFAFDTNWFNSSTLSRFNRLTDVREIQTPVGSRRPSQDEYAWALQNFINRRANPWKFFEAKEVTTFDAGVTASAV